MNYNIARYLTESARQRPDAVAIYAPGRSPAGVPGSNATPPGPALGPWRQLSFRELDQYSDRLAAGLAEYGVARGARCLVMVRAGIELIALTFALFKRGAVPVLIDPGMGRQGFLTCVSRSRPTALLGIPLAHVARLLFPSAFSSVTHPITVGRRWFWGGATLERLMADHPPLPPIDSAPDEVAAILFTSGSTGPAKGVVYTHAMFDAQVQALQRVFDFQPGEVDLAAFPLFSLFDCALGMTSVIPDLDPAKPGSCRPEKVEEAARLWKATSATGSPAIWRRVYPWCKERKIQLPDLRRLLTFGAPVTPALVTVAREVMPNGDVFTPYGATESLPVACIRGREILEETQEKTFAGAGTCVGKPDLSVAIIGIQDEPVADMSQATVLGRLENGLQLGQPGTVGEICVSGPVVTRVYDALPDATAGAKMDENGRLWHRMGDLGYLDVQGRLWFCGRKAERVETVRGPLYTDQIEGRYNGRFGVERCALVGPGPRGHQRPLLLIEGPENKEIRAKILEDGLVEEVLFRPKLPVDSRHNAKIHRLTLKKELEGAMVRQ